MKEYVIQPWGTAENDLVPIPSEVIDLAKQVMTHYDLKLKNMMLITSKPEKGGAIWKIETDKGPYSLKLLHRSPPRSLFSLGAQEYLVKQGALVPKIIRTKTGKNYVEAGGKVWFVAEWIDSLSQASKVDLQGAEELCMGLAKFHRHSQGYVPPSHAEYKTRLHRYPHLYQKMINKMDWFRTLARTYSELPASKTILSMVDEFQQQAREALEKLENSPYANLVAKGEPYWGLAHQDYGWSNGQKGPGGIWIIDLDGVAYDFPIRDLRKLIASTMDDMGEWNMKWIKGMIQAYHQVNPIEPDLYQILLIDMSLPNEFYKHVKDMVYNPTLFLNNELKVLLQRLEQTEKTKQSALKELSQWKLTSKGDGLD